MNKVRDDAIVTICSNLLIAGVLLPEEVGKFMAQLCGHDNVQLSEELCQSRSLLDAWLQNRWSKS